MELFDSIESRISIRAFKPDKIPREAFMELLRIAARSPSGVNSQPWEFFVVQGDALGSLRQVNLDAYKAGKPPKPEVPVGIIKGVAPVLTGVYKDRQVELAKKLFKAAGIEKGDAEATEKWNEDMVTFYGAPAVIILVVDKVLQGSWPILDIGLVVQCIVLAAQEFGLGTCIMRAIVDYPDDVRTIVGVPEEKRIVVGIAIGYPDYDQSVNQLRTSREKIEGLVTFVE